ncbi:hypothetical protein ABZ135_15735 [Streptomyces sp. NPDC006339]|uniref:hypothetical protein n=1 Tax=Streptomyces sp. NPDC006339 TaxID=3156755 RepID=UPI0033A27AFC
MARSAAHGGTLVLVTAVLLGALTACGAAPEEEGPPPCPSSTPTPSPTPTPAPTASPGDSRTHSVDPERDCLIESGTPDMPVDP